MSKQIANENYRVEVEVDMSPWVLTHGERLRRCESVARDIRRHVDGIGRVSVRYDSRVVCSYCGAEWEEPPCCCNRAVDEWDSDNPVGAD